MSRHQKPRPKSVKPNASNDSRPGLLARSAGTDRPGERRPILVAVALSLLAGVIFVFWPLRRAGFINLDDDFYVSSNPQVLAGIRVGSLTWAWRDTHLGTWHPLTWISHMVDAQFFGQSAAGHHLTSVALHGANVVLLFLLLQRSTGVLWPSALVAALFGFHPMHVESVAWISERKDVLSTLFFLLTLLAYVQYAAGQSQPGSRRWYWVALALFAAGLLCKPMLVSVPFVLLLLDWWPLGRFNAVRAPSSRLRLLVEKSPFFLLALVDGIVTVWAQGRAGAVKDLVELPLGARAANALVSYWVYVGKIFWPTHLSVFYPFQARSVWAALMALVGLVTVSIAAYRWRYRWPMIGVGWLWYLATITPVIGFLQTGMQAMADRYSYIPFIGLFITLVWMAVEATRQWQANRTIVKVGTAALLGAVAAGARQQTMYWQSSETLFRHSIAVTQNNALAHHCLGSALAGQGALTEAADQFQAALRIRPEYQAAEIGLGIVLARQGNRDGARVRFERALERDPQDAEAHFQFGVALAAEGMLGPAITQYHEAVRLRPGFAAAYNNLGNALQRAGRIDQAVEAYQQALRVAPDFASAHNNLGIALAGQGKTAEAIAQYRIALNLEPNYAEACNNLGNALAAAGQLPEAISTFRRAITLRPIYPKAENSLGCALAMQGNQAEAIEHLERAVAQAKDYAEGYFNLANAYAASGRRDEARVKGRLALDLALRVGNTNLAERVRARLAEYDH